MNRAVASTFNLDLGAFDDAPPMRRRLSELRGAFADERAYEAAVARGDTLVYTVSCVEPAGGGGQLHYALGRLMPGKVGAEFFLTRGHLHAWRAAAEVYLCLRGHGLILLEHERTGESRLLPLRPNGVIYVPGHAAHRTINIGGEPLVYLGVYPAGAGHDYGAVVARGFRQVVVDQAGQPVLLDRVDFLKTLAPEP